MNINDFPSVEELMAMWQDSGCLLGNIYDATHPNALQGDDISEKEGFSPFEELMSMTGLDEVKCEINRQLSFHRIMTLREKSGKRTPKRLLNMLLIGNPGTGKTTCARLIGQIYQEAGILSTGQFVEVSRATLVGEYIGHSEKRVSDKIEEAKGGILFIDEIYSLADDGGVNNGKNDFGHNVIDTLMPVLSDPNSGLIVIGAGYPDEMGRFLRANSGLASRFPVVLGLNDFSLDELMNIAHSNIRRYDFIIAPEAETKLRELIKSASRNKNFGNARFVVTLIENHVIPNLCMRLDRIANIAPDSDLLSTIVANDIPDIYAISPLNESNRKCIGFGLS